MTEWDDRARVNRFAKVGVAIPLAIYVRYFSGNLLLGMFIND